VRGSSLPLSIIIVGVGDADFSSMDILDADDEPLYSRKFKKYMDSDIVQFVPFSEFKHDPRLLARETLEEVPRQFVQYMERNGIVPKTHTDQDKIKMALAQGPQGKEDDEYFKGLEMNYVLKAT